MKKIIFSILTAVVLLSACETSEGIKAGTLQKVSHKTFPCSYYVAEFAFEGGRASGSNDSKAYANTQEVEITKEAFDSLQNLVGSRVRFSYKDEGFKACAPNKKLETLAVIK